MKNTFWLRLVSLLVIMLTATSGFAQFDPTRVYRISCNKYPTTAMEVSGGTDESLAQGRSVQGWGYWGGAKQQWYIEQVGTDASTNAKLYKIVNRNSGQALEVTGARPLNPGVNCNQWYYWGGDNQKWVIQDDNGIKKIYNYGSGLVLFQLKDSNEPFNSYDGSPYIKQMFDTNTTASRWTITDVSADPPMGVYQIINANSGKVLSSNGADNHVSQWTNWGFASQQWSFSAYNSDNYLAIVNRNTQQVLEIGGGGDLTQPGRTANLWGNWGGQNQQWALLDVNDSHVLTLAEARDGRLCKIYNRLSGKVLEIGGNGSELYDEDRAANQWYDWGGANQQWYIQYVSANRTTNPTKVTTAAREAKKVELSIYPNPAHDLLTVNLGSAVEPTGVSVTDVRGSATSARYQGHGNVDISNLAPGLYIVSVQNGQHVYHQKFIKE